MKSIAVIKKVLTNGCVINTALLIVMYLLGLIINENYIPTLDRVLGILLFSVALSASNMFLFSKVLNFLTRLIIHYVFNGVVFYFAFIWWGGYSASGKALIVLLVVFTVIYFILFGITALIRAIFKKSDNSKKKYEKIIKDPKVTKDNKETKDDKDDYKPLFGEKK